MVDRPELAVRVLGSDRREKALEQFRSHYGDKKITKWDIFHYVYGVLHHPGYRQKFADNLKRELPRIPFAPALERVARPESSKGVAGGGGKTTPVEDSGRATQAAARATQASGFWAFAAAGKELARLHLDYEKLEPWPLEWIEDHDTPLSYRVEDKIRLSKDKKELRVNPSLTLAAIPTEVYQYRLGNRSALEWVIDQYQVKEDKRSGIRSDPNRTDDSEYIVRLVGQVVRVSVGTVKLVAGLPVAYA